ncbi:ABC transporter substrate-binding protein [Oceanivirga salmonicida]|uniref:ABC transporter substrate-binding protein n=1 Tax=Oceanivirga salmonicida TaxID=1769291 RepID=UPI0008316686|nr:ABC transporter substrate-binding protein [Oceanivirga salmonicida]
MKKILGILMLFITLLSCGTKNETTENKTGKKFEGKELSIYVSFHEDMAKKLAELFEDQTGAKINYIRLPTGQAVTRIKAEASSPQASVWIGGTADAQQNVANDGLLESFEPENSKETPDNFKDSKNHTWTGIYVEALSIGVNTERFEKEFKDIPIPTKLEDLLNPAFKGEIILPDPNTSGTGLTIIASILESMGEEKGWEFISKLFENVAQFTSSGYTPAEKVGTGEYLITINFLADQLIVKDHGFPIEGQVYEGAGWNIVPVAKIKGGANPEIAEEFINFSLNKESSDALVELSKVISIRPDSKAPKGGKRITELPINKNFDPVKAASLKKDLLKKLNEIKPK